MKSAGKKSERLNQLELLLLSHPEGLRRAEIARRLGVHRATAGRYIDELSAHVPLWEQDFRVGIKFSKSSQLSHIGLLEGLSFYLGLRFFAENSRYRFPEGSAAIRKLSSLLKTYSPALGKQLDTVADSLDCADKEDNPFFWEQLEHIGEAWMTQRPVRIIYQEGESGVPRLCLIRDIRLTKDPPGIEVAVIRINDGCESDLTLDMARILSVDYTVKESDNSPKTEK